jgi:hypothetical protein
MHVGTPIPTAGLTMRDLEALSARVLKALEDLYYSGHPTLEHGTKISAELNNL